MRIGDYGAAVNYLLKELDTPYPKNVAAISNIDLEQLFYLGYYNALLGVLPPEELEKKYRIKIARLAPDQKERVNNFFETTIAGVEISSFRMSPVGVLFPTNQNEQRKFTTLITTVVPAELPEGQYRIDNSKITITPINDPFVDPNFQFCHNQPLVINGFPIALLSPLLHQQAKCSLINVEIESFFHPDFSINENGEIEESDRAEREVLDGKGFDPYIAKVAEVLLALNHQQNWSEKGVVLNAMSDAQSCAVNYIGPTGESGYHFYRPLRSVEFFIKVRDNFLNIYRETIGKGISRKTAHAALLSNPITNNSELRKFCGDILIKLIARPMATSDLWKDVWVSGTSQKTPENETDVQRKIFHIVHAWFEKRGLSIHRGALAAGGQTDFLVEGRDGIEILRCPIELKFAHHAHLSSGIAIQLPAYMDALETNDGILLVIWCKGKTFDKPTRYETVETLEEDLKKAIPSPLQVDIVTVDASFRFTPSQRR